MENDLVVSTSSGRFRGQDEGSITSFGTFGLDDYRNKVGAGSEEARLSHDMISALVSFAKDPAPPLAEGQAWFLRMSVRNSDQVEIGG